MLNNIGTHVDPVDLINRVPNGVKIKGLRDALVKILQDYRVQLSLLEGSKKIISGDCLNLMDKQIRIVRQGISVEGENNFNNWAIFINYVLLIRIFIYYFGSNFS